MSLPIAQSSGDLIADRRFAIAQELLRRDDLAGAADLLTQAIDMAPRFVSAWFWLGDVHERLGSRDDAIAAFQQVCALDPEDRLGAGLHLVRLGALAAGDMPMGYVRTLFDQYAGQFDTALPETLRYRGPQLVHDAIARACADAQQPMRFADMLDLGCGTGLAGAMFRPLVGRLTGVDLSERMIAAARAKQLYDRLEIDDIMTFLHGAAHARHQHGLVVAADVCPYLAWLPPLMTAVSRVLVPGGLFGFTAETHAGDDVILGDKLRYAHGVAHVRAAVAGAGLTLVSLDDAWARQEAGVPAPGLVVVARL